MSLLPIHRIHGNNLLDLTALSCLSHGTSSSGQTAVTRLCHFLQICVIGLAIRRPRSHHPFSIHATRSLGPHSSHGWSFGHAHHLAWHLLHFKVRNQERRPNHRLSSFKLELHNVSVSRLASISPNPPQPACSSTIVELC